MRASDLLRYSASFYKKDCTARIKELAGILELDLNKKIEDMSLGNKKKVGIVQGLLHSPKLIILDEPTSGLDPLMQRTFFDLIKRESEKGSTVFFSSHILSEVQRICDRVAIIKEGRIISTQKIADLRQNAYKKVSFTSKQPLASFELEGASDIKTDMGHVSFIYSGNINLLVNKLGSLSLENLDIAEPELEEVFMNFYAN
jgi:ABC-2 type transport system ATP-binding protein